MYKILQIAIITILCDQLSKLTMLYLLDLPSVGKIDVFPPYLQFTMAWNYGVNFGLFANSTEIMRWVLIIIAFLICFVSNKRPNPCPSVPALFEITVKFFTPLFLWV